MQNFRFLRKNKNGIRIWLKRNYLAKHDKPTRQSPPEYLTIMKHLVNMGIASQVKKKPRKFASSLFLIDKGKSDFRPIFNYKKITSLIHVPKFTLPNLFQVVREKAWNPEYWYTKIDIKQAFFNIPLHEKAKHITTIDVNGEFFQFNYLPFGIANAPYVCQLMVSQVKKYIMTHIEMAWVHLDDFLLASEDKEKLRKTTKDTVDKLKRAKWLINEEKTVLSPKKEIT